jgi:hypothetical protein
MGEASEDSWEDFEVPILVNSVPVRSNDDEEEDETLKETVVVATQKSAGVVKKAHEEEAALAIKMEHAMYENESSEQKRLRERKQAEEADVALAGDLFQAKPSGSATAQGPSMVKSIAAVQLKTKDDHTKLGTLIAKRLTDTSAFNVAAFYKALYPALRQPTITTEILDDIMRDIKSVRDSKAVAEKPLKTAVKKSKKEIEAESRKHAAKFGGYDTSDKYDHLSNLEDEFM